MAKKNKRGGATPKKRWQPLARAVPQNTDLYERHGITPPNETYANDLYSVFVREIGNGALHISFHRHDRAAVRDWRHFQAIKNEVAGPERTAIEIFPPESQLVDQANEYHLWVLPVGFPLPFVIDAGVQVATQDEGVEKYGLSKARQRPWERGIPTGRGLIEDLVR